MTQINHEACAWIAKLHDGEPSSQEREALRQWMQQSSEHKAELRRMAQRWDELNFLTELAVPVEVPSLASTGKNLFSRYFFFPRAVIPVFSTVTILVLVALLWLPFDFIGGNLFSSGTYTTGIGEQKLITLPDKSTALLNTNSRLRVDYTGEFRNLYLMQGEASFDVMADKTKPFQVFADDRVVRAVGTSFSVSVAEQLLEVTVVEGSVQVESVQVAVDTTATLLAEVESPPMLVEAGQSATFSQVKELIETVEHSEIMRKLAWQEGLLRFSGAPLDEVLEEFSRYTQVSIVILDEELRNLRIGGFFRINETEKLFEALESGFNVQVDHIDENIVHLSLRKTAATEI